ncbi:hypothetical protein [Streptomyces sp. NPDC057287]|uniref:hypothetical protein n=1 Tax=Streptomyces sp. NPDC057287 TaxID=3346086 RepID=UPI00362571BA
MAGKVPRWARGAAVAGAALSLAVSGWLVWSVPVPHLAAVVGVGPVDGTMKVTECYEATDADGDPDGYACEGVYTPRSAAGPQGGRQPQWEMTLHHADEKYEDGTLVEVRTAGGKAHEYSGSALTVWTSITWFLTAPFLGVSIWLLISARHADWARGNGYVVFFLFTMPFSPLVLGCAALVVEVVRALLG